MNMNRKLINDLKAFAQKRKLMYWTINNGICVSYNVCVITVTNDIEKQNDLNSIVVNLDTLKNDYYAEYERIILYIIKTFMEVSEHQVELEFSNDLIDSKLENKFVMIETCELYVQQQIKQIEKIYGICNYIVVIKNLNTQEIVRKYSKKINMHANFNDIFANTKTSLNLGGK